MEIQLQENTNYNGIQLQENTKYNGNTAARKYKLETERKMQNYSTQI